MGEAVWPAIVERGDWEAARAILSDRSRRARRSPRSYLLTGGIACCGLCSSRLVARPVGDGRRAYVCASGKSNPAYNGCGRIKVLAKDFEEFVVSAVLDALDGEALAKALAARAAASQRPDIEVTLKQVAAEEAALEELARDHYADRIIGRAEYLAARRAIEGKLSAHRSGLIPAGYSLPQAVVDSGQALRDWWASASLEDRPRVVAHLDDRVIENSAVRGRNRFDPDRVAVVWAV